MSIQETSDQQQQPQREALVSKVEAYTKEEPIRAVSAAFGAGLLLTLLPVGSIISGVARLLFIALRPLLMILGILKLVDDLDARRPSAKKEPHDA